MTRRSARVIPLSIASALVLSAVCAGEGDRLQRALDWPRADLTGYERLYIEDVRVTDPEAPERKNQQLVESVPQRMANFIAFSVDPDLFSEVERGSPDTGEKGLILRVGLTQYKPGSAGARFIAAGAGAAHLNLRVALVDAASGEELTAFDETRQEALEDPAVEGRGGRRVLLRLDEHEADARKEGNGQAEAVPAGTGDRPDPVGVDVIASLRLTRRRTGC